MRDEPEVRALSLRGRGARYRSLKEPAHFFWANAMNAAMASPGTGDVMADLANYTTIAPVLQISEIVEL